MMVEFIQDYWPVSKEQMSKHFSDVANFYLVPDESFEADLDENFTDALNIISLLRGVNNIKPNNFLRRPKKKEVRDDNGEVVGEEMLE
jgi:hypothetical protein